MITSGTTELAKERRLHETRFATSSFPTRRPQVMSLRPPSFRIVLALVGASLVLFGARGVVLGNVPMIQEVNLFDWSRSASWLLEIAVVAVIPLAWIRPAMVAWLAWGTAVGALAYMLQGLWTQVELFSASSAASAAAGEFALDVPKILQSIEIRPGAVAILSGLTIQAVGLCLKQNSVSRAG
jgi:hypothetical protein